MALHSWRGTEELSRSWPNWIRGLLHVWQLTTTVHLWQNHWELHLWKDKPVLNHIELAWQIAVPIIIGSLWQNLIGSLPIYTTQFQLEEEKMTMYHDFIHSVYIAHSLGSLPSSFILSVSCWSPSLQQSPSFFDGTLLLFSSLGPQW